LSILYGTFIRFLSNYYLFYACLYDYLVDLEKREAQRGVAPLKTILPLSFEGEGD